MAAPLPQTTPISNVSSTSASCSAEEVENILNDIRNKGWWQGSIVSHTDLLNLGLNPPHDATHWVIASQTCNLYNCSLEAVPYFELIAAQKVEKCDGSKRKGDHPRVLHTSAESEDGDALNLELDIQRRYWLPRALLSQLPPARHSLKDGDPDEASDKAAKNYLDCFAGWVARSYTRTTLPDEFNDAFSHSKLRDGINSKLVKRHTEIYGIFLKVSPDSDSPWRGHLGNMPPPYLLEVLVVTYDNVDLFDVQKDIADHLFSATLADPVDKDKKVSRAELAGRLKIHLSTRGITGKTMSETSLSDMRSHVRYSFADHLSSAQETE